MLVYPASRTTYLEALKKGLIRILAEAGAIIMPPGCCTDGEPLWTRMTGSDRCLTTGDIDCHLRHSSTETEVYACSPATVAASAINAAITDPVRYLK